MRQSPIFDSRRKTARKLTTLSHDYERGWRVPTHWHEQDQLIYASRGVMTVRTDRGCWLVPPLRAVWMPARMPHSIDNTGRVSMRTLYFKPKVIRRMGSECRVVNVSTLLRELIHHACNMPDIDHAIRANARLIAVIVDQIEASQTIPLQLPYPSDSRAVRVAETLLSNPSDSRPLVKICRSVGASKRTVERLFQQETQITVGKWRQQLRLLHGIRRIAEGENVTQAAVDAGYNSPSAFVSMFRKVIGMSPRRYFANDRQ